jgi:hypothetical protein
VTFQSRDKRALIILGAASAVMLLYWAAGLTPSSAPQVAAAVDTVDRAEKRLANLRGQVATLRGKEEVLKQASAELAQREKTLIGGDTAEQAQAQLLQVLKRAAAQQGPPLEIRQVELGPPRAYGDAYGEVTVSLTVDCRIDELINFLATLSAQPELTATDEIRFGASNPKQKIMPVRLTVSGLVAKNLVPVKKGLSEL